jgi:methylmalonyl-CoA mutase C-terminal domain/subunit
MSMASSTERKTRIKALIAKPGLDGHDRGAKVLAHAMREAGMEVVYSGLRQTPAMIVAIAVEEDVDIVCVSIMSGAHLTLFAEIMELLRAEAGDSIPVLGGGIIPAEDIVTLKEMGVREVFTPGAPMSAITACIEELVPG